ERGRCVAALDGMTAMGDLGVGNARTTHRDVIDRLRRAILIGVLPAGTRLVQADLARRLRVSVTPVREALRDLVGEGLVDFDPYRGATVHSPTLGELEDIYEIRTRLTPPAVQGAVDRATESELAEAEALGAAMESTSDPAEWVDLNRRFHAVLIAPCRRAHLLEILTRMSDLSTLYVGVSLGGDIGRRERGDHDHHELVSAYRARDVGRAVSVSLKHVADTLDDARAALLRAPAPGRGELGDAVPAIEDANPTGPAL
ncbi:GntR family transcriptional regulator, partial [Frankia sp. EI5c]|uniref:GntR family transcriptional regulator n=1 Tax=Frankia sp. EI5c TaxID=683316 RepID=UPI001A7EDFC6